MFWRHLHECHYAAFLDTKMQRINYQEEQVAGIFLEFIQACIILVLVNSFGAGA